MKLVENEPKYYEFIRELRNDKEVKKGFIQQKHIDFITHNDHMRKFAKNYWVCLVEEEPAGYVGQIDDDIRVATHPDHQGKGVGTFMISELINKFPDSVAKVKIENKASLRLFEKCGFKKKYYILEKE
jgi:GNAT superfamily N-acetyltransferase